MKDKEKPNKAEELAEEIDSENTTNPLTRKSASKAPQNDYRDEGEFTLQKKGKALNDLRGEERALAEADHERLKKEKKQ